MTQYTLYQGRPAWLPETERPMELSQLPKDHENCYLQLPPSKGRKRPGLSVLGPPLLFPVKMHWYVQILCKLRLPRIRLEGEGEHDLPSN